MGWQVQLLANDVKIPAAVGKKILATAKKEGCDEIVDLYEDKLYFNSDHQEHMDYLSNYGDWIIDVLKKAKAKGRILFRDSESSNPAEYWGHEFDGKGGYTALTGTEAITWMPKSEGEI